MLIIFHFFLLFCSAINAYSGQDLVALITSRQFVMAMQVIKTEFIPVNGTYYKEHITPLMAAVKAKHFELVKMLLHHGADPNARDHEGNTALFYIDYFSSGTHALTMLALLRDYGADVNSVNNRGQTVMWLLVHPLLAECESLGEFARLFLRYGADISHCDYEGKSITDIAGSSQIKDLIIMSSLFIKSIFSHDINLSRALLKVEPSLIGVKYDKKHCLQIAKECNNQEFTVLVKNVFGDKS